MDIITKRQAVSLGLKKYFTGKPCKHGHISERYTLKSTCIECLKISSQKRIHLKNDYDKNYYHSLSEEKKIKERERLRITARKKYWSDPEKYRKIARDLRNKNIERERDRLAKWKEKNPNWSKEYRQLDHVKEIGRIRTANRRSKVKNAIPKWSKLEDIEFFYKNCPEGHHVDHIVPLQSKIVCGLHCVDNFMYLSPFENMSKGNRVWPDMP